MAGCIILRLSARKPQIETVFNSSFFFFVLLIGFAALHLILNPTQYQMKYKGKSKTELIKKPGFACL
jgi:hypothetical protein